MPVSTPIEPITASDAELRKVLEDAHLTGAYRRTGPGHGRPEPAPDDLIPDTGVVGRALGGFMPDQQVRARQLAFEALVAFRDGGCVAKDNITRADLRRLIDYVAGGETSDEYVPLLEEELAFPDEDARAPKWNKDQIAPGSAFSVAVIGAGMSGIVAAIRLKQAGVPFTIIEKNSGIGGTWWENTYPGARVDNANHMYSDPFAQKADWPFHFSTQGVLQNYFNSVAEEYGLLPNIRFETGSGVGDLRRKTCDVDAQAAFERKDEDVRSERPDQRRGAVEPPQHAGYPRHRQLRGAGIPFCPLGSHRRPQGQARRP